jgi:hypothetical protein
LKKQRNGLIELSCCVLLNAHTRKSITPNNSSQTSPELFAKKNSPELALMAKKNGWRSVEQLVYGGSAFCPRITPVVGGSRSNSVELQKCGFGIRGYLNLRVERLVVGEEEAAWPLLAESVRS